MKVFAVTRTTGSHTQVIGLYVNREYAEWRCERYNNILRVDKRTRSYAEVTPMRVWNDGEDQVD